MERKPTVLIIEDELNIRDLMETILSKNGYVTVGVESAELGLKKIQTLKPSLILLDLQLPHMDGLECCKRIRQDSRTRDIPVILVSVQSSDIHKIIGLESGADDFIAKPFNHGELLARVKAVLRRAKTSRGQAARTLEDSIFSIDLDTHQVTANRSALKLTPKEYAMLVHFIKSEDRVVTRDELSAQVWERENLETSRTIDVHVGRLRKKLGKFAKAIQTVGKIGYRYSTKGLRS